MKKIFNSFLTFFSLQSWEIMHYFIVTSLLFSLLFFYLTVMIMSLHFYMNGNEFSCYFYRYFNLFYYLCKYSIDRVIFIYIMAKNKFYIKNFNIEKCFVYVLDCILIFTVNTVTSVMYICNIYKFFNISCNIRMLLITILIFKNNV